MVLARWMADVGLVFALLSPWVGLVILVVVQGHNAERIRVLEQEIRVAKDNLRMLMADLGWKQE